MKHKTLLKISTLIIATASLNANLPGAFAEGTFDGRRFWTAEDFLAYEAEAENDRFLSCGENVECRRHYYIDRIENDDADRSYARLDSFNTLPIVLSSINPAEETMELIFRNQEAWSKNEGYLREQPGHLDELYMVWLDESVSDPIEDQSWFDLPTAHYHPYYVDEIVSGSYEPGTHLVYSLLTDDTLSQPDVVTKVQIAPGNQIADNTRNKIFFFYGLNGVSSSDAFDYSACVNHPYYREGMTCKFIIDEYFSYTFVPFTSEGVPATAEDAVVIDDSQIIDEDAVVIDDSQIIDEGGMGGVDDQPSDIEPADQSNDTEPDNSIISAPQHSVKVTTPNTGAPTSSDSQHACKEIAFPWWLITLLLAGNVILIWFFMPTRRRK